MLPLPVQVLTALLPLKVVQMLVLVMRVVPQPSKPRCLSSKSSYCQCKRATIIGDDLLLLVALAGSCYCWLGSWRAARAAALGCESEARSLHATSLATHSVPTSSARGNDATAAALKWGTVI
ncbi:hypothetical protein PF011_g14953 [Phytophthora fragariae]|uniref:Uncharacterized protein n=1 Tax=Phytophthora fragariae TaxID=53985 RepID=A0A6A3K1U5_9STRA|nr:hypothetical protein PF011_g14953 [Phytophthora fragariae]